MSNDNNNNPEWIEEELFENVARQTVGDFKKIQTFKAFNALKPGENYATVMLKVHMEIQLQDDSTKVQTFMLKVAHDTEIYLQHMYKWNMFAKESGMYRVVLPEMEQIYRDKGLQVQFGPKSYELPTEKEYILLEDLAPRGFRNAKRQEGLDMLHCKTVLKKLAQWHAASAVRVAQKGFYPELYCHGYIMPTPESRQLCEQLFSNLFSYLVKAAKRLSANDEYIQQVESMYPRLIDSIFDNCQQDPNEFNVLNHGDVWTNNVMFQYDDEGVLKETYFVDYQAPRYGSPAQDLWYFIISSPKMNLKIDHFDEMIHYYYENLIENLNILEYNKPLPLLRHIHASLIKHSAWAALTLGSSMAGVLCEPSDDASIENFAANADGCSFLDKMFFNDRFTEHATKLLPWLFNKGVFE